MAHKNLLNQNYDWGEPEPVWPIDNLYKEEIFEKLSLHASKLQNYSSKTIRTNFFTCPFNIQYLYQYQSSDNSLQNMCTQYVIPWQEVNELVHFLVCVVNEKQVIFMSYVTNDIPYPPPPQLWPLNWIQPSISPSI